MKPHIVDRDSDLYLFGSFCCKTVHNHFILSTKGVYITNLPVLVLTFKQCYDARSVWYSRNVDSSGFKTEFVGLNILSLTLSYKE